MGHFRISPNEEVRCAANASTRPSGGAREGRAKQREGPGRAHFDEVVKVYVEPRSRKSILEVPREVLLPRARKKRVVRGGQCRGQAQDPRWFRPGFSAYLGISASQSAGYAQLSYWGRAWRLPQRHRTTPHTEHKHCRYATNSLSCVHACKWQVIWR